MTPVLSFISAGGLAKVGFSGALELAKKMQAVSDKYHEEVLDIMVDNKLPKSADPFLVQQAVAQTAKPAAKQTNSVGNDKSIELFSDFSGFKTPTSGAAGLRYTSHDPSSLINGVGGARGMSGLFNGMGGTGTNGLVDGLGFSSGLNGFVNGAGSSSGTSGYLNDLNVMTPVNVGSGSQR